MKWILESLTTTDGYLQSCRIDFSSGLNCIIGARGTCKSTVVETIRFVFDCEPEKIQPMISPAVAVLSNGPFTRPGLLLETLAGGTAKCSLSAVDDPTESRYVVERNARAPSRVYRDGVQQIDDSGVLHRIEIYSQGDLQSIAERPERRLALIDRPNQRRVADLAKQSEKICNELKKIGFKIRQLRAEIESRQAKVMSLNPSRKQLSELQASRPTLSPELEAERVAYTERCLAFERLRAAEKSHGRAMGACLALLAEEMAIRDASEFARRLNTPSSGKLASHLEGLLAILPAIRSISQQRDGLSEALASLGAEFEALNARYYDLRKDQQAVNDALKTEEALRQTIGAMEAVEFELAEQNAMYAAQLARRRDLRAQRDALSDELYTLRLGEIEKINAEFGDQIVLTLEPGVLAAGHRKLLEELLHKSNLRNQPEVARDLAEKVKPSDLVDIVETSDAKRLADALGRDLGQMTRLVTHLLDSSRLYELENMVSEDSLQITMVVRGEARPIEQLSKGQMATALLPLILRDAEYPLIVDQPEDDLDNAFVTEKLIERLKSLSYRRQLIFVTHNANIPVLGDAARVVVMEMSGPRKARPCSHGSVDAMREPIIQLLEGGKEAFKSRQEKYGSVLQ